MAAGGEVAVEAGFVTGAAVAAGLEEANSFLATLIATARTSTILEGGRSLTGAQEASGGKLWRAL